MISARGVRIPTCIPKDQNLPSGLDILALVLLAPVDSFFAAHDLRGNRPYLGKAETTCDFGSLVLQNIAEIWARQTADSDLNGTIY